MGNKIRHSSESLSSYIFAHLEAEHSMRRVHRKAGVVNVRSSTPSANDYPVTAIPEQRPEAAPLLEAPNNVVALLSRQEAALNAGEVSTGGVDLAA